MKYWKPIRLPRFGPGIVGRFLPILLSAIVLGVAAPVGMCDNAPAFDLVGPKVDVHVQRDGKTLPIGEVPNLLPGDRLWIHPDVPASQSPRFVLIVAFLRGSTNKPPDDWFRRVETWSRQVREEGVFVVVPAEAEQALVFLAPETIGDFSTLRKAVQGRPGAFVRASQDLQQASWDRLRLDAYLAEVKNLSGSDAKLLKEHTELAARSLGMRIDQQCFDKPTEQQAPCLVQHTDGLVLDDSNAQSAVNVMANGAAGDMMNQISYSNLAGAGQFSPYVGAVLDLARILSSLHTAKFQYIPALALPKEEQKDTLNLRLNVPPSFRDPKSVIVVALPPVGPGHAPPLHASESSQNYCAPKPGLALLAEGAPLVFATAMAHDLTLHVETKAALPTSTSDHVELAGKELPNSAPASESTPKSAAEFSNPQAAAPGAKLVLKPAINPAINPAIKPAIPPEARPSGIDIPIRPDPSQGGFVLTQPLPALPEDEVVAELRGRWGFDSLEGPKFHLRAPHHGAWTVPTSDLNALITGREDMLHIEGGSTLCVADIQATFQEMPNPTSQHPSGSSAKPVKLPWKSPKPDLIEVAVPLKEAAPGTVTIAIHQYGLAKPEELPLKAYAEAAAIDHLSLSAGDKVAVLKGRRLDEVDSADLAGITFTPAALNRVQDFDQLQMSATGVTATLQPGTNYSAKVTLHDGRTLHVPASVGPARPQIDLLSKGVQHEESEDVTTPPPFHFGSPSNPDDLPLQRRLVFFLRSRVPAVFARTEKVELAAVDGSFETTLSLTDGSLMLEDTHTAVAVLDPLARFGASAFGPIHLRAVTADGVTGDWVPLGTLVRLPGFPATNALRCPRNPAKPCQLTGSNLFLITSVGATQDMANAVDVPPDFTGNTLSVPNTARLGVNGPSGTNATPAANGSTVPSSTLYLRLRDDPDSVQTLNLPVSTATTTTASEGTSVPPVKLEAIKPDVAKPESTRPETSKSEAKTPDMPSPTNVSTSLPSPH